MVQKMRSRRLLFSTMFAILSVCLVAGGAEAGTLNFRNDTEIPVIVQGLSVVNNVLRAGKRHTLQPGEIGTDQVLAVGNKVIIVADAKQPTKILYQGTIQVGAANIYLSIKPDVPAPKKADTQPSPKPAKNAVSKVKLDAVVQPFPVQPSLTNPMPVPAPTTPPPSTPPRKQ